MILPSVTQVLAPYSDFSRITPEVLEHAAARGTAVHAACAAHARGLWAPRLDAEVQPYLDSFRRWFDTMVVEVRAIEFGVRDEALGYCGHPDFLGVLRGDDRPALVDWKTPSALKKIWLAQVAAYQNAVPEPTCRGGLLRLRADGSRAIFNEVTALERHRHFAYFLGALTAYRGFIA